jgi:hypothetical protein
VDTKSDRFPRSKVLFRSWPACSLNLLVICSFFIQACPISHGICMQFCCRSGSPFDWCVSLCFLAIAGLKGLRASQPTSGSIFSNPLGAQRLCRYCYQNQISVVQWNLAQLATALLACDLVSKDEAQAAVDSYGPQVLELHNSGMARKLGLAKFDSDLVTTFLRLMFKSEADFTNTFRAMAGVSSAAAFEHIPPELVDAFGTGLSPEQTQVSI